MPTNTSLSEPGAQAGPRLLECTHGAMDCAELSEIRSTYTYVDYDSYDVLGAFRNDLGWLDEVV